MSRKKERTLFDRARTRKEGVALFELQDVDLGGRSASNATSTLGLGSIKDDHHSLPTSDGGSKAWLFMVSAFLIEAVMWGFPLTFGIFAAYYGNHPNFRNDRNDRYIPIIGVLSTGIPFLGAPLITPLTARFHSYQRQMIWGGWIICILSLIAASFATTVAELIVTQGVAFGLGFLVLYYALLSMLNEWFIKRRGLAYGILFAAAGMSGTGLPFLIQSLLQRFGYAATLRGYAVAMLVTVGPTLPLCRGRYSFSNSKPDTRVDWSILKNPIFWGFSFSNLFQGVGFYLPGIYLPSFAASLAISPARATLLLCLLNGAQVLGQVILGWISDELNVFFLLVVSTLGSALLVGLLWFLAADFGQLLAFSLMYGLFAGCYSVLWARFISTLTANSATTLWLYGLLAFQRGLGNIVAGPISVALFQTASSFNKDPTSGYRGLILFVAVAFLISSFGGLGWFWDRKPKRRRSLTLLAS